MHSHYKVSFITRNDQEPTLENKNRPKDFCYFYYLPMSDLIRKNETINCVSQISSSQISASGLLHGPTRGVFFGDPDPPRTNFVGLEAHEVDRGAPEMDPICGPVVFNLYL